MENSFTRKSSLYKGDSIHSGSHETEMGHNAPSGQAKECLGCRVLYLVFVPMDIRQYYIPRLLSCFQNFSSSAFSHFWRIMKCLKFFGFVIFSYFFIKLLELILLNSETSKGICNPDQTTEKIDLHNDQQISLFKIIFLKKNR